MAPRLTEVFRIVESSDLVLPLVGHDDVIHDVAHAFWERVRPHVRLDPAFVKEAESVMRRSVQRTIEGMLEEEEPGVKLRDMTTAGHIRVCRVDASKLRLRGDYRYDSEELADVLRSGKDLVPVEAGESGGGLHVIDGHHRARAGIRARVPILANVCTVDRHGKAGTITLELDLQSPT